MPIIERLRTSLGGVRGPGESPSEAGENPLAGLDRAGGGSSFGFRSNVGGSLDVPNPFSKSLEEAHLFGRPQLFERFKQQQDSLAKIRQQSALRKLTQERGPTAILEFKVKQALYSKFQFLETPPEGSSAEVEREFYSREVDLVIKDVVVATGIKLPDVVLANLKNDILDGIMGFGPIQKLLNQENLSEIMVNGPDHIYIERGGKLQRTNICFRDPAQLYQVIEKIVIPVGRRCDEFFPYCDARLPDGSRVNIIIPPLSLVGPVITIRRFSTNPFQVSDLVKMNTLTQPMADFIRACVESRQNLIVSGGTGSGKTTTLNAISGFLPATERIVTIEDSAELQLLQPHVVSLETRQANVEGKGQITIRDLFRNALRMIPKRVVVGECRGAESLDMIGAMSAGNRGSLTTAHANTPKDMLARLETMIMMAGMNLSSRMIRELISSALNIVVQQERLGDGKRRITHIAEVIGIVNGEIQMEDIYKFVQTGVDDRGTVLGVYKATGYIPKCLDSFFEEDLKLPENLFEGVASVAQLKIDWKTRIETAAREEAAKIKAKIALQMAMEDVGPAQIPGIVMAADTLGGGPGSARNFGWEDALGDMRRSTEGGRTEGGEFGPLLSVAEHKTAGGLVRRLKVEAEAKGQEGPAVADRDAAALARQFKRQIIQVLPARLAFERGDRPFASREEEEKTVRGMIEETVNRISVEMRRPLPPRLRATIIEDALADVVGLGPIQRFIADPDVSEVMVNGPDRIYVEIKGKLKKTSTTFEDDTHVIHILRKIITPVGRRCDETNPMVDARTQEGFRLNAIIRPLSIIGPVITIRKFADTPFRMPKLIEMGSVSHEAAEFIRACINLKQNIFVSGGTGSGKTTTLNAISEFIPECRIVTIEDAAELRLLQEHVVSLETRPPNLEGKGQITIRDLVRNALHMRPDRIIVGECRGGEALDMISSMSTGNQGSLSTGHANTPEDLLRRLETMVMMSGVDLPLRAIREQIAAAVDLIIQQDRMSDGTRKITHVSEVLPATEDGVRVQHIFKFKQEGVDPATGKVMGSLRFTGVVPTFLLKFLDEGVTLPEGVFGPKVSIKDLLTELDQRRREVETEALRENLKKSRTYEETVLLDAEFFEKEGNPLAMLDDEEKTLKDEQVPVAEKVSIAEAPRVFNWREWMKANYTPQKVEQKKMIDQEEKNRRLVMDIVVRQDHSDILVGREGKSFHSEEAEREYLIKHLKDRINEVLVAKKLFLKQTTQDGMAIELAEDFLRLGPIQPLMDDDSISEIMINGPKKVFIERKGKVALTPVEFRDDEHLMRILNRILSLIGRRCDANSPLVDARTRQGYRLNAVIPPVSSVGAVVTIRKFSKKPFQMTDLIRIGAISSEMADLISGTIQLKLNVVVSGGTGSGKTTMLNAISAFIPALDMLQAMNTGTSGSLTTAHASSPKDMMSRLETMSLMAKSTLTAKAIREQIASAVDLVIQVSRFRDGTRKVTHVSEVKGMREDGIELQDIFVYEKCGLDETGRVKGTFKATGNLPSFLLRFHTDGIRLPENLFGEGTSLTKIYERLLREAKAREAREKNRQKLRSRWGSLRQYEEGTPNLVIGEEGEPPPDQDDAAPLPF
ncbi:MAG: CpaF family protein [Candidatus Riflebacteria bacterium]|nr:CpaF family protein [Candidatus Riflebacteria bacterium]